MIPVLKLVYLKKTYNLIKSHLPQFNTEISKKKEKLCLSV